MGTIAQPYSALVRHPFLYTFNMDSFHKHPAPIKYEHWGYKVKMAQSCPQVASSPVGKWIENDLKPDSVIK